MCGICGELRLDGAGIDPGQLERMLPALASRGPDDQMVWQGGHVAFGHRRLAVIDPSPGSRQPLCDAELVLVFNGAIYNYRELRRELRARGHGFVSDGDSEVILKAYREWGEACPQRLDGMFAFAIWDAGRARLFLVRDRFGIKPLYYTHDARRFRFASNPQALLAGGGVDTRIDPVGLQFQFTLHGVVPAPNTILRGVRKLAPAHSLTVDEAGDSGSRCYWRLDARPPSQQPDEEAWVEEARRSLLTAVRDRYEVADVPVGVLLSGGLDSSLLLALLAESGARDIRTYSIGFEDQPEERGNEFLYSDQLVECYQTRHERHLIPNARVLACLPDAVDAMAEPMFGQDAVAFHLLGEQVSRSVKVVQSGQGADELFGGYLWQQRLMDAGEASCLERFRRHYFDRAHDEFLAMVGHPYRGADHAAAFVGARLVEGGRDDCLAAAMRLDVTGLLADDPLKRVDNMMMAWGVESRVPFLDHRLVECVAACPPSLQLQSGGKHLLKRMARGIVPDAVIDRPKGYFPVPALKFVRGDFLDFIRGILDSRACRERGLFQRRYVEQLLAAPEMHHTRLMGNKLWQLALFEFWLQRHVDGAAGQ